MRDLTTGDVHKHRDANGGRALYGTAGDGGNGTFAVPSPRDRKALRVIASNGGGWDHMQLHVPPGEHVDFHSRCLHLWRPQNATIPRPPSMMVGPQ